MTQKLSETKMKQITKLKKNEILTKICWRHYFNI